MGSDPVCQVVRTKWLNVATLHFPNRKTTLEARREWAAIRHAAMKNIERTKSTARLVNFALALNNRDGNLALCFRATARALIGRRRKRGRVSAQTFSGWHLYCEGREIRAR
jgi:hypothetical protein